MSTRFNAYDSRSTLRTDPLRNFKFLVEIQPPDGSASNNDGITDGLPYEDFLKRDGSKAGGAMLGFMSVGGLNVTTQEIPYREGGDNTTPRKLPGQTQFGDITLQRGVVIGTYRNWNWFRSIFAAVQGHGLTAEGNNNAAPMQTTFRYRVRIHVLNHPDNHSATSPGATVTNPNVNMKATPKMTFHVFRAWPKALAYSDLDAGANGVMVESMTLAHEGFDVTWTNEGPAAPGRSSWNPSTQNY